MTNQYDLAGPIYVGSEPGDVQQAATDPGSSLDFSSMNANDISKYAQEHPEWFKSNGSLVDYWLNEKSYESRSSNNIKSQFNQLQELGVNPVLAMSLLNGGTSLSGGASSSSDSYFASQYSSDTSRENNITSVITKLVSLGITSMLALLLL